MTTNGVEDVTAAFEKIGDLERKFAAVELDALRRKEFSLKPLFEKRKPLLENIPDFWPSVFPNGPDDVQNLFSPLDYAVLGSLKSFVVERYQIESETKGEPRSLRFTFEFGENDHFEDTKLVKEFEFVPSEDGPGNLISKPVPIKWKSKKNDLTEGLLGAAVELYNAEEALKLKKGDQELDIVERESLWQYEKLREKLESLEEASENEPSFMSWFGFRGAVGGKRSDKPVQNGGSNGAVDGEDEDMEDEDELLDVEIFPAGEEVAICLADDLWPDVMDYFMRSQMEPTPDFDDFEEDSDDDEDVSADDDAAPELVAQEDVKQDNRPRKRQRTD